MIKPPPGFARQPSSDGLLLVPPAGRGAGVIRYHERLSPVDTFGGCVARTLAGDPGFVARTTAPRELLITHEGEHAARVSIDGAYDGSPARRFVGAVLVEDFVARVDVLALGEAERRDWDALSRELIEGVTLRLGDRPRRFAYRAPRGWHAVASGGLAVSHYPPDYPRHAAQIVVFPAEPAPTMTVDAVFERVLGEERARGRAFEPTGARRSLEGAALAGRCATYAATLGGRTALRELCVAASGGYVHVLRLDSFTLPRWSEAVAAFDALVASMQAVPGARPGGAAGEALSHWID